MRDIKLIVIFAVIHFLAACGGGGGDPGTVGGKKTDLGTSSTSGNNSGANGSDKGSNSEAAASDFYFEFNKFIIQNSGSDKATLTVTTLDANNNVVAGVPVTVKVDSGSFTGTTATAVTASDGTYSGAIRIGPDKSNRTISVTITAGSITKMGKVYVTGAVISANLIPANPAPGASATLEVSVKDSANIAVPFAVVNLSGTLGFTGSETADASGTITKATVVPNSPGPYQVIADGLGFKLTRDVQVTSALRVPSASGTISSASLSAEPSAISPNVNGSSSNKANLRAKFLNARNEGIANVRVQFKITSNRLPGESISVGDGVVYTDEKGEATADYIPGSASSPTEGVEIKACYKTSDFTAIDLLNNCANLNIASTTSGVTSGKRLTVAAEPVSISISDYSKLEKGASGIDYLDKLLIQVTNAVGQGVQDAQVSASVNITHYGKGPDSGAYDLKGIPPPADYASQDSITPTLTRRVWCANEDLNRSASIDIGEDKNGNGRLDPVQAAVAFSYLDNKNTTDVNGQMFIRVSYGQKYATWLAYTVTVTTKVKNSEGSTSMRFITAFTEDDKDKGTFHTPPFGILGCTSQN